ncbi:MAG: dimethylamine monooxygenase subunit DmmA family protein [Steroidobacteraceae bacterium]
MRTPAIKSRPVYAGLQVNPHARRTLFALQGEGAKALFEQVERAGREFLTRSEVLFLAGNSVQHLAGLQQLAPHLVRQAPNLDSLLQRLRDDLAIAKMGTSLQVAGTEGFIGQVLQVAMDSHIDAASICTEHRGSLARRVQCVHCKQFTDGVTHSPFACSGCGLGLLVRDHYSRRLGAFQGVNVDAEAPGTAPSLEELYP